jgi:Putative porin
MKRQLALFIIVLIVAIPDLSAAVSDEEVRALREQIRLLSERIDQLEQANSATSAAPVPQVAAEVTPQAAPADDQIMDEKIDQSVAAKVDEKMAAVSWAERIRWSGDFRYRYEDISIEGSDDRNRNRIRARTELQADISPTMKVGIGLASGSDDPVSTNQTLGGGGSHKPISIDLAYFEWSGLSDTKIKGGKFKNDLYRPGDNQNALVWDSDWRPEGTTLNYNNGTLFLVGLGSWLESDSDKQQQLFAYGIQGGVNLPVGDAITLTTGAGYYNINSASKKAFYPDDDFFGNSFDPVTQTYLYDYHELEVFGQMAFSIFARPTIVYADYVYNLDPEDNNTAYSLGFRYGLAKAKGTWEFGYSYRKIEEDGVLGLLSDSDFGAGGADAKGSVFTGAYAFHDNWNFSTTYYLVKHGLDAADSTDVNRLQLDLNFKFK